MIRPTIRGLTAAALMAAICVANVASAQDSGSPLSAIGRMFGQQPDQRGAQEPAEVAARVRGIRFPATAEIIADVIAASGVPRSAVIIGTRSVDNTADEALMLKSLTANRGWRTVIVVTSKYHTRRAGYAMRRALAGSGVDVVLRASRYDPSDPARWWRGRRDVRLVADEWQKLIAYRLGLAE